MLALRGINRLMPRRRPNYAVNEAATKLMLDPDIDNLVSKSPLAQGTGTRLFPKLPMPASLPRRLALPSLLGVGTTGAFRDD
jgi:hypothetical protein